MWTGLSGVDGAIYDELKPRRILLTVWKDNLYSIHEDLSPGYPFATEMRPYPIVSNPLRLFHMTSDSVQCYYTTWILHY